MLSPSLLGSPTRASVALCCATTQPPLHVVTPVRRNRKQCSKLPQTQIGHRVECRSCVPGFSSAEVFHVIRDRRIPPHCELDFSGETFAKINDRVSEVVAWSRVAVSPEPRGSALHRFLEEVLPADRNGTRASARRAFSMCATHLLEVSSAGRFRMRTSSDIPSRLRDLDSEL